MLAKALDRLKSKIWRQILLFPFFGHSDPQNSSKLILDDGEISPGSATTAVRSHKYLSFIQYCNYFVMTGGHEMSGVFLVTGRVIPFD